MSGAAAVAAALRTLRSAAPLSVPGLLGFGSVERVRANLGKDPPACPTRYTKLALQLVEIRIDPIGRVHHGFWLDGFAGRFAQSHWCVASEIDHLAADLPQEPGIARLKGVSATPVPNRPGLSVRAVVS